MDIFYHFIAYPLFLGWLLKKKKHFIAYTATHFLCHLVTNLMFSVCIGHTPTPRCRHVYKFNTCWIQFKKKLQLNPIIRTPRRPDADMCTSLTRVGIQFNKKNTTQSHNPYTSTIIDLPIKVCQIDTCEFTSPTLNITSPPRSYQSRSRIKISSLGFKILKFFKI